MNRDEGELGNGGQRLRTFESRDRRDVIALWAEAGVTRLWNDAGADIDRKQRTQPELFIVAEAEGRVVGTAMAGYDGHRGWIHYVAVATQLQGSGLGRALVRRAEELLLQRGCPKVQLQVRPDNAGVVAFYEHLGYAPYEAISMGRRLIDDGA